MSIFRHYAQDPDAAPAALVGRVEDWAPGSSGMHRHQRHQFITALAGVLYLHTAAEHWVLPPGRALFIAAGTEHAISVKQPATAGVLYACAERYALDCAPAVRALNVSPLVRELLLAVAQLPWTHADDAPEGRLCTVLVEQLERMERIPTGLPLPRDRRALRLAHWLIDHPVSRQPLELLVQQLGSSKRTMERLFLQETQMSLGAWRQRLRMLAAVEQLAQGHSVGQVALATGYQSASSFVVAFRQFFGTTPAQYCRPSADAL